MNSLPGIHNNFINNYETVQQNDTINYKKLKKQNDLQNYLIKSQQLNYNYKDWYKSKLDEIKDENPLIEKFTGNNNYYSTILLIIIIIFLLIILKNNKYV